MLELLIQFIAYQIIQVNQTTPCFLNYTAGVDIWRNCGMGEDYLEASLLGWNWITGGYFSMILVAVITLASYIKYHKALYPIMIGTLFLPITYFVFPEIFLTYAIVLAGLAIGIIGIWYTFIKQTKEY